MGDYITAEDVRRALAALRDRPLQPQPQHCVGFVVRGRQEINALREFFESATEPKTITGVVGLVVITGLPIYEDGETPPGVLRAVFSDGSHMDHLIR